MSIENKNVAVIGLGLMGGAIAQALKKQNPAHISAFDINQEILEEALKTDVIDFGTTNPETLKELLQDTDLVFICLYPVAATDFINDHMEYFKPDSIITDIVGIKIPMIEAVKPNLRDDIHYIPGHPMAGSEKEGFGAAKAEIFDNRNYVLVPLENTDQQKLKELKEIIADMGFSNIVETTPLAHDEKIAFTSQLCHIIASALVDSEDDMSITDYEGGSFGDLTRIAMINAPMWTEIFIQNKDLLLKEIDEFESSMKKIRNMIVESDSENLEKTLKDVRRKRVAMEIDRQNKHRKGETRAE